MVIIHPHMRQSLNFRWVRNCILMIELCPIYRADIPKAMSIIHMNLKTKKIFKIIKTVVKDIYEKAQTLG